MNRRGILLVAAWFVCVPVSAAAQVPTLATKACGPYALTALGPGDLDKLTALYNQGNLRELTKTAQAVLKAARTSPPSPGCTADLVRTLLNYDSRYIALTWIGQDPLEGKPRLMRTLVHRRATGAYSADLPGVDAGNLVEIFLARSMGASLTSVYTSTREDNPVVAQLPAFVQAIAGPLFAGVAGVIGPAGGRAAAGGGRGGAPPKAPAPPLYAAIYRVGLPFPRASVRLQASAIDGVDGAGFDNALSKTAASVTAKEAAYSDRARTYADIIADGLAAVRSTTPACGPQTPNPSACMHAFDLFLHDEYGRAVAGAPQDDVRAVQAVDQRFRDLIKTAGTVAADLDVTFHNRPLTQWSFGAGSAVIGKAWLSKLRVKLDDSGNLKADPLTRVMTMAFVNWSPKGYDEQADHMQAAERWRPFFGAALTPDFGPIGGLNVALVRGIGLTAGAGVLFAKGADQSDVGKPPADTTDAFRLSLGKIVFAGISYNFK